MPLIEAFADNGEDHELVWLAGFERTGERGWIVRAVTRVPTSRMIKRYDLPIGFLPFLTIGRWFRAGDPSVTALRGTVDEFALARADNCEEVTSDHIPATLFPVQGVNRGVQHALRYRIGDLDVFVPTIELVRYLFVHNKTLANVLMQPGGIMELFRPEHPGIYDEIHLHFTDRMPVRALTKSFVAEFAWIAVEPDARRSWDSVSTLSSGKPYVSLHPPPVPNSTWTVRWVRRQNAALVLEIVHIAGRRPPCKTLRYSHPSIRERHQHEHSRKATKIGEENENDAKSRVMREFVIDDQASASRIDKNQPIIAAPSKLTTLDHKIEVALVPMSRLRPGTINAGPSSAEGKPAGSQRDQTDPGGIVRQRSRIKVGVADDGIEDALPPIEFRTLEPADPGFIGELEPMRRTMRLMGRKLRAVQISTSLYVLKEGRAFSRAGQHRRPCLIAVIRSPDLRPRVLIEVDHSGGHKLSSLALTYSEPIPIGTIEDNVKVLIDGLIDNGGSWNTDLSETFGFGCACTRLPRVLRNPDTTDDRSFNNYCWKWAMQLIERLRLQDFVIGDR